MEGKPDKEHFISLELEKDKAESNKEVDVEEQANESNRLDSKGYSKAENEDNKSVGN